MQEKGSPFYNLVLLFLSIYILIALMVEAFFVKDEEIKRVLQYIDFIVCIFFLVDFFVNFFSAKSKMEYMKWGWIDLISSIPAIDPLRWGRVSKIVRIVRYLRAIKSIKVLLQSLHTSKIETLSLCVFLVVFVSYSLSSAFILDFEREYSSEINSAESALWWSFLNLMNAKTAVTQALSPEGITMTIILNKVGLLLFAYVNSMIVAWLVIQRQSKTIRGTSAIDDCE